MIFKNIKINKKGFTVLELMVSVVIFAVVCVSVLELVNSSMKLSSKNNKTDVATDLASEAIEVITTMRDNNFLNNRTYTSGILNSDRNFIIIFNNTNNSWTINYGNDNNRETINSCSTSSTNSCKVYRSNSRGFYTQARNNNNSDLIPTEFYRLIRLQNYTNYIKITSTVLWKEGNINKTISLEKNLWNWK